MRLRSSILLLSLLAAALGGCAYERPSPVGTNCVQRPYNPIPVCTN